MKNIIEFLSTNKYYLLIGALSLIVFIYELFFKLKNKIKNKYYYIKLHKNKKMTNNPHLKCINSFEDFQITNIFLENYKLNLSEICIKKYSIVKCGNTKKFNQQLEFSINDFLFKNKIKNHSIEKLISQKILTNNTAGSFGDAHPFTFVKINYYL